MLELVTDEQHHPVVRASAFEPVEQALYQIYGMLVVGGVAAAKRALRKAQRLLARALPPEIPPLRPFQIVEV